MSILDWIKARLTAPEKDPGGARYVWVPMRTAGVSVTPDSAIQFSAYFGAIRIVSQTLASLPWNMMVRQTDVAGRKSSVVYDLHPAHTLIHIAANEEVSAYAFKEQMAQWALSWGNGYAEIERDNAGRPRALYQLHPSRVTPKRIDGQLMYDVWNESGSWSRVPFQNMYHLKGMGYDGLVGYSVASLAARAIGLGLATERFGSNFFQNGARPSGVLQHPKVVGDAGLQNIRRSVEETYSGTANAGRPIILEEGMTWTSITIPPEDAQFLETRKFQVIEMARWFGVPPHKLAELDRATFSNIEEQNIDFVQDCILPWTIRFESEANMKFVVPRNRSTVYSKMNLTSLLRGDSKSRADYYQKMWSMGVFSVNDILELEDRNTIGPEGDKRLVQLNLTTLDKVGEEQVQQSQQAAPTVEGDDEGDVEEAVAKRVLEDRMERVIRRERNRWHEVLKRYDGDRDGLLQWMAKFARQHNDYARAELAQPLDELALAAGMEVNVDNVLSHYLADRINVLRDELLDAFDRKDTGAQPTVASAAVCVDELLARSGL